MKGNKKVPFFGANSRALFLTKRDLDRRVIFMAGDLGYFKNRRLSPP
jgi:hypothetical protein